MKCVSCQCENPDGIERCQGCGAALPAPPPGGELEAQLLSLLDRGEKIGAIKLYREAMGAGLAASKDAVEALERSRRLPVREGPGDMDEQIAELLARGEKIKAIKVYRTHTGVGLKEAKEAVEAFAAERRIVVPGGSGCLGMIAIMTALLGFLAWTA